MALRNRFTIFALNLVFSSILNQISPASATVETPQTISISEVTGITPPVGGAAPVESITPTNEYSGSVLWSDSSGALSGNFRALTIYRAVITLIPEPGFAYESLASDFFSVEGAKSVFFYNETGIIEVFFDPRLDEGTTRLNQSFGSNGSVALGDIFGDTPLTQANSPVSSLDIDRIALDSENRIVVLGSFYSDRANRSELGAGYRNSLAIAAQPGNDSATSAAVAALSYRGGNRDDWYLPSIDELVVLYSEDAGVGGLQFESWSSTESYVDYARTFAVDYPNEVRNAAKADLKGVRPIRSGMMETPTVGEVGPGGGTIFYAASTSFECGRILTEWCNYLEAAPDGWLADELDPLVTWATGSINQGNTVRVDHHILFRINADGTHDNTFGSPNLTLRRDDSDTPKRFTLITTTNVSYAEKVDLEIDSQDRSIVLLSGTVPNTYSGKYHDFIARYESDGLLDLSFGEDGAIGSLAVQEGYIEELFADVEIDGQGRILTATFVLSSPEITVYRYTPDGLLDDGFGMDAPGAFSLQIAYPDFGYISPLRNVQLVADELNGYLIAFTGGISAEFENIIYFSQLFRLHDDGIIDVDFVLDTETALIPIYDENILPWFVFTEITPDGPSGFLISGTYVSSFNSNDIVGFTGRFQMNGMFDQDFFGDSQYEFNRLFSRDCFVTALNRFDIEEDSRDPIFYRGQFCVGNSPLQSQIKGFSSSGELQSGITLLELQGMAPPEIVGQTLSTNDGKLIVLSGVEPSTGMVSFWSQLEGYPISIEPIISSYQLFEFDTGSSAPLPTPLPSPSPSAVPSPYLRIMTSVKISIKESRLSCLAGTYNAGYVLGGVNQGSTTSIYEPSTYQYNLYIDGFKQDSLTITSDSATISWNFPSVLTESLISCSVTVSFNGITRIDHSTDNKSDLATAIKIKELSLFETEKTYKYSLTLNEKYYQRSLVENRNSWRNESEKIRNLFRSTLVKLKNAITPTEKKSYSTELRVLSESRKKLLVEYTSSKPAALAAKELADKKALESYENGIGGAHSRYKKFIEDNGYGVFAPRS